MTDKDFYARFTDRHRGSRELIKSRLEVTYVPFIEPLKQLYAECTALDLGCGRGEWLELLQAHGFKPHGIDLDDTMLAACRERGLSVEKQDVAGAFAALADESQLVVSGFHIAEHLPFETLQTLVREAWRVLKPGGLMILETPNPENILVSTSGFYVDPTHRHPIPPNLLSFLSEYHGFARAKILRLYESPDIRSKPFIGLTDVLGGVSPDYAIVAQKPCSPVQTELTGLPFALDYGLTLDELAARYDAQIEARLARAEERTASAEAERQAVYASHSWRLTQPLRRIATAIRRWRSGKQESDLAPVAPPVACVCPDKPEKQLFIDVSEMVLRDARTGIQRVTRSILKEFLDNPPAGLKVAPVYAAPDSNGYRYARDYAAQMRGQACEATDESIAYAPGDIFLGMDLQHRTVIAQRDYLMRLSEAGVTIYFAVFDLLPIHMPHAFALEPELHSRWLETITSFDGALCISRTVADELLDWLALNGQHRTQPFNINWFHLGADIANSVPTLGLPEDAAAVLGRIAGAPSFLTVGTVEPRKGHRQMLEAFESLWARGVDINLVVVGKQGWLVDELAEQLRQHPELGKHLFWLDAISDEYLERVYAASACLIAASEGEGFGLPLIEAAKHTLPIIARDIPVFREVAGEHALYFDGLEASALASAVENWLALAAAGKATPSSGIQWLTWAESAEQLKRSMLSGNWYRQWLPAVSRFPLRDKWYDPEHPVVSLIVLNFNKPSLTMACLHSLWEHTQGYRYEIVLVDNGSSTENYQDLAPAREGARLVRLDINRFFGEGNNLGFEASRGRYVVFLNNDITATAGWLAPLIQRLENHPDIGAVGPKMLLPDNTLGEAGAEIRADGSDNRYGRGADPDDPAYAVQRDVMYISAAALAMRRETFEQVLGFDLYYEPAYYEDCDLCLKIRQLNLRVTYCPDSSIVHQENATTGEYAAHFNLGTLIPLNRARFLARWQQVLTGEVHAVAGLIPPSQPLPPQRPDLPCVLLYTPYDLVPGGGERYLLTIAAGLLAVANVTLATPHPYSRLRLLTMGRELSLDLNGVRITALDQATRAASYDASIVMGNEALPGIPGKAKRNIYLCQFPFPAPREVLDDRRKFAGDYGQIVVYSEFAKRHYALALQALGMPLPKITVVSPPAPLAAKPVVTGKKPLVLGVGRFFLEGHAKRQDLMIDAFRRLFARHPEAELHLAGSLSHESGCRSYFAELQDQAAGLPVFFHPNASPERLSQLYADASLYWHLAGYGMDEATDAYRCEHFGITVVEAMSAGCIPLVVDRGGPPATVQHGVTGYVFETLDELVSLSDRILSQPADDAEVTAMRTAAVAASGQYSEERFIAEFRDLMTPFLPVPL